MDLSRIPILGRRQDEEAWYYHTDYSWRAQEIKPELRVFLRQRGLQVNWIVTDRDPQGADYIVMTVQEPSGGYRPFDGRALETLRKICQRGPDIRQIVAELETKEAAKAAADAKRDDEIAHGIAEDLKYAGRVVTDSVASRKRSQRGSTSSK